MNKENFYDIVKNYSMTSKERIYKLYECLEYIRNNEIKGDIVECGVWKGGNILGISEYLNFYKIEKKIWLYDTFQGMTQPEQVDVDLNGNLAKNILQNVMCHSPLELVQDVLKTSSFNFDNYKFVVGDINDTLNFEENIPSEISLLRLDTDWYKSTKKELDILYPLLVNKGSLIIDDYGHWNGCKKAVDEYFGDINNFEWIDYTGIFKLKK
jgi:O-methyltransferase